MSRRRCSANLVFHNRLCERRMIPRDRSKARPVKLCSSSQGTKGLHSKPPSASFSSISAALAFAVCSSVDNTATPST